MMNSLPTLASALGGSLAIYASYRLLDFVWLYTRPSTLSRYLRTPPDRPAWALVTGASDGIGKAIATELAARGFNVILHGRNAEKVEAVGAALAGTYRARSFRTLIADASQCHTDAVDFGAIAASTGDVNLTVLVNNAGSGAEPAFGALQTYAKADVLATLHLNAAFPTLLSAALVPALERDGPGLIVNVASVSDAGLPLVSFYGASKAFANVVHVALGREMRIDGRDVEVVSHRVGAVTGVTHVREPGSFFRPAAEVVARAVLARTGCGRSSVVPYWPHRLQLFMLDCLPEWLADRIICAIMRGERTRQDQGRKTE